MSDQRTLPLPSSNLGADRGRASDFSRLSPEIQSGMYRRLGGVALVYSGAWVANFLYFQLAPHNAGSADRHTFWYTMTALCTGLGVLVYFACRARRVPPARFHQFAVLFEIAAALGIMAGYFGWEHHGEDFVASVATAFGLDANDLLGAVVQPLEGVRLRLLYHEGVSWVGIWLLAFPLVVPLSTMRTVVATLLTASTVPVALLASNLVNGVPESVQPWTVPYALEASVSTFICAGIAIFGSRVVYGLTRDLSTAQQMGSYQLVERIGAGGMGEVWKAKHRLLARPAAIKFIHNEALGRDRSSAATALRRFEREAQATSGLTSQHSVDLYDFGVTDDGTFYYVMELLEGVDLRTLVERYGPVPAGRAIHILRQACHSLDDAHFHGVVHRDIKPGNLFLCRRGPEYDFVKVLDFGLVKHVGDGGRESAQLTVEGIASGTPAFMAPEMAQDGRTVDGRADLYALGCVAYWLVTGQLVFVGESPVTTLLKHVHDVPEPPSTRTELEIPSDLERVILACLEKDPDRRPQSARALSRLLEECERSAAPWDSDRTLQWWQTHLPDLVVSASSERATETSPAPA